MVDILLETDAEIKSRLINEIGLFACGKSSWLEYQDRMETTFDAHGYLRASLKKEIFIAAIGAKTLKIVKHIVKPQNIQDVDFNDILCKLESHFYPNPDRSYHLTKFQLRKQRRRELFLKYVCELRKLLGNCNFGKSEKTKLKNQIIKGAREELRELFVGNLNLSMVFEKGIAYDHEHIPKAPVRPRNHKARQNREDTCFRCKIFIRLHADEVCPFEWASCSHCKVVGHASLACKYQDVNCKKCGEKGHIARLCKKVGVSVLQSAS